MSKHQFVSLFICFLLLTVVKLSAQPVNDNNGVSVNDTSIANFMVPAGDDRLLVVCTTNGANAPHPVVTFGSTVMNVATFYNNTNGLVQAMYYLELGSGSSVNGAITAIGSLVYRVGASSYHNVNQSDPVDGETNQSLAEGVTSSTLMVNSTANGLACDCISYFANAFTGFTVNPGQNEVFNGINVSPSIALAMSTKAGASPSVSMGWMLNGSTTGGGGSHLGVNLKAPCPAAGTIWYVDASAPSGGTGTSWTCAFQHVQDAINAASSGHEIWVKAGTYLPTEDPLGNATPADLRDKTFYLKDGVALYGGFDGTETMRSERDWMANVTILSGDIGVVGDSTDNCYHVVLSVNDGNTTVLDGFTVFDGNADGSGFILVEGSGVFRLRGGGLVTSSSASSPIVRFRLMSPTVMGAGFTYTMPVPT